MASTSVDKRHWNPSVLLPRVAYALVIVVVGLSAFTAYLNGLMLGVLLVATIILLVTPRPFRDLQAWLAALGVQFSQAWFPNWRFALADILFLPLVVGTLLWWWGHGRRVPRLVSLPWLIGLVLSVCVIGTLMAWRYLGYVPFRTVLNKDVGLLVLVSSLLIFALIVDSRERLHAALRTMLLAGLVVLVAGLLGYPAFFLFGIPTQFTWDEGGVRLVGLLVNPSAYSCFLMVLLLLILGVADGCPAVLRRSWALGAAVLIFAGILLTFSRSSWLACLAGLAVLLGFQLAAVRHRLTPRVSLGVTIAMTLALAGLLGRPLLNSASGSVWSEIVDNPVAGYRTAANLNPTDGGSTVPTPGSGPLVPPDSRPEWRWTSEGEWLNDASGEIFRAGQFVRPSLATEKTADRPDVMSQERDPSPNTGSQAGRTGPAVGEASIGEPASGALPSSASRGSEPSSPAGDGRSPTEPASNAIVLNPDGTPRVVTEAERSSDYALYMANAYMNNDAGLRSRLALNVYALRLSLINPLTALLGIGVGSFLESSPAIFGYQMIIHNSYVWLLTETGIVGLIMLAGLLGSAVWVLLPIVRQEGPDRSLAIAVLAGLAAMATWMLANEGLYQRHFWVLLAVAEVLHQLRCADQTQSLSAAFLPTASATAGRGAQHPAG